MVAGGGAAHRVDREGRGRPHHRGRRWQRHGSLRDRQPGFTSVQQKLVLHQLLLAVRLHLGATRGTPLRQ